MSHPLSISSHQGLLEPTTTRPGFISTVTNTVLALPLHWPPALPTCHPLGDVTEATTWVLGTG